MTNNLPAPPENSLPGYYYQQLVDKRYADPYCDKVLTALAETCNHFKVFWSQRVTASEAILRLYALTDPIIGSDAETELLLKMLDYFKKEIE
jgi:hypothetical protein